MKTLFLDINGDKNYHNATSIYDQRSTLPHCIELINSVIAITNCKIVVISNWAQTLGLLRLQEFMTERGLLPDSIVDAIQPVPLDEFGLVMGIEKDKFIEKYINENKPDSWAVVDDNLSTSLFDMNKIVKTNTYVGITENEKKQLITLLS